LRLRIARIALVIRLCAVTFAASDLGHRRYGSLSVHFALGIDIAIHNPLALSRATAHLRAVLLIAHQIGLIHLALAAAHLLRGRRRSDHTVHVEHAARHPLALSAARSLVRRSRTHRIVLHRCAFAAAWLDRRGGRLRGRHLTLGGILRLLPVTALIGAFVRRHRTQALCVGFVAIAITAARGLRGRRGRGGP